MYDKMQLWVKVMQQGLHVKLCADDFGGLDLMDWPKGNNQVFNLRQLVSVNYAFGREWGLEYDCTVTLSIGLYSEFMCC